MKQLNKNSPHYARLKKIFDAEPAPLWIKNSESFSTLFEQDGERIIEHFNREELLSISPFLEAIISNAGIMNYSHQASR